MFLFGLFGGETRAFTGEVSGLVDTSWVLESGPGGAPMGGRSGPGAAPTGEVSIAVVQLAAG